MSIAAHVFNPCPDCGLPRPAVIDSRDHSPRCMCHLKELMRSIIIDKIEATITAGGKSCRDCATCGSRETLEPTCTKYRFPIQTRVGAPPIEINRFCSVCRAEDGPCGVTALGFVRLFVQVRDGTPQTPEEIVARQAQYEAGHDRLLHVGDLRKSERERKP